MTRTTIIDGWLSPSMVAEVLREWPSEGWFRYDDACQCKSTLSDWRKIPALCRRLLSRLATEFREGSIPDLNLWGSGLCEMKPGDFLGEHLDHDVHPHTGLKRTHNAILFLGGDGDLIVGRGGQEAVVSPTHGRVCVFDTTDEAYHRVGKVTAVRRTLSVYFYDPSGWIDPADKRTRAEFVAA